MPSKERLLEDLKRAKKASSLFRAEAALAAWGFRIGRSKGHVRVWSYRHITITMHVPHGKDLDPGAVAMAIRKIEEAAALQRREEGDDEED
jgi:hypothetical protein